MPLAKSFAGGLSSGLDKAVPLMMEKMRMDATQSRFDVSMKVKRDKLVQDAQEASDKIAADNLTNKIETLTEVYQKGLEMGDTNLTESSAASLREMGMPIPETSVQPQFEDPYVGPLGNLLQKSRTGEVEKIAGGKTGTLSPVGKLVQERDALPADDPKRAFYDAAIQKAVTTKGMKLTVGPDGEVSFQTGVGTEGLSKKVRGDVQVKMVGALEGLARIGNIVKSFKPEYQEIPTRLGVAWTSLKEKFGVNVPKEDRAFLEEFSAYKQDALENINLYIKEITGAQMSEKEANRLRKAQPDPGEGLFDGDSPSAFKSKLINQYKKLKLSTVRYSFYLKQGVDENTLGGMVKTGAVISLEKMEKILKQKEEEYIGEIVVQDPLIDTQSLMDQVTKRMKDEFGL